MKAGETGLEGPPVLRPGEVSEKKLYNTNIEDNAWCLEHIIFKMYQYSPWEPPWALEELDIVGFMIDSGLKLSHEQHEPDWQNCSLEHFALISAN